MGMMDECWNGNTSQYRAAYKVLVGPVADDVHLHHKCENRRCYNPRHLEPLTPSEHGFAHAKPRPTSSTLAHKFVACTRCDWTSYRWVRSGMVSGLPCPKCGGRVL